MMFLLIVHFIAFILLNVTIQIKIFHFKPINFFVVGQMKESYVMKPNTNKCEKRNFIDPVDSGVSDNKKKTISDLLNQPNKQLNETKRRAFVFYFGEKLKNRNQFRFIRYVVKSVDGLFDEKKYSIVLFVQNEFIKHLRHLQFEVNSRLFVLPLESNVDFDQQTDFVKLVLKQEFIVNGFDKISLVHNNYFLKNIENELSNDGASFNVNRIRAKLINLIESKRSKESNEKSLDLFEASFKKKNIYVSDAQGYCVLSVIDLVDENFIEVAADEYKNECK